MSAELAGYGAEAPWFSLGDKDIATHLVRTRMLDAGYPLSEVTRRCATVGSPGSRLLPMTDNRVETHVVVVDPERRPPAPEAAGEAGPALVALHFQEWWIRYRAALPALSITPIGAADADPGARRARGDRGRRRGADRAVQPGGVDRPDPRGPGHQPRGALEAPAPVVGFSPIIAGAPVRGHADSCLAAIGVECSAQGVAAHYGPRSGGGLLDAFLIADGDHAVVDGLAIDAAPLLMTDPDRDRRDDQCRPGVGRCPPLTPTPLRSSRV